MPNEGGEVKEGGGELAHEAATKGWIEAVLGERLGECSLQEELRDGVVLCNLMNKLKPVRAREREWG